MRFIPQIILGWLLTVDLLHAQSPSVPSSPRIELGAPETILTNGQFGLRYFPDERISVINDASGCRVWLAVEVRSVLLQGRTLQTLGAPREILLPGKAGEFDNGYAGISGLWRAPAGEWVALYHAEDHEGMKQLANGVDGFYARVALAVSRDDGKTFAKRGPILSGQWAKNPAGLSDQGVGEPWLVVDSKGEFLYAYYTSHERVDGRGVQICVARCPVADAAKPAAWRKHFNGDFTEPGLGGRDTPVLVSGREDANAIFPHVTWLPARKQFVMLYCVNAWQESTQPKVSGIYAAFSDDGLHWPMESRRSLWTTLVTPVLGQALAWHPTFVPDETAAAKEITGWLYYGASGSWGDQPPHEPHYLVRRRLTMLWP